MRLTLKRVVLLSALVLLLAPAAGAALLYSASEPNVPGANISILASFPPGAYLPETPQTFWGGGYFNWFTVSGDLSPTPGAIPEPSTIALAVSGLALMATLRRRTSGRG